MDTENKDIRKDSFIEALESEDKLFLFKETGYLFGSLFWHRKNGKTLRVLDWGDCYESKVLNKWLDQDIDLEIKSNFNFLWCRDLSRKYAKIKRLSESEKPNEKERQAYFQELGLWFKKNSNDEVLNQDLIIVSHYYFFNLSEKLKGLFYKLPEEVRRRNLLIASHMVVVLILCRYTNFGYLRDVYNTCLLLDYKFSFEMWGHGEKGNVLSFYKNNNDNTDFLNQDFEKYQKQVKSELIKGLTFKGVSELLDINYEKLNGSGYTNRKEVDFCDEDSILIMLVNIFKDFEKDTLLEKLSKPYSSMGEFPIRIRAFLKQSLGDVDDEYLEVEGL